MANRGYDVVVDVDTEVSLAPILSPSTLGPEADVGYIAGRLRSH